MSGKILSAKNMQTLLDIFNKNKLVRGSGLVRLGEDMLRLRAAAEDVVHEHNCGGDRLKLTEAIQRMEELL